jgi:hypothetical protein
MKQKLLLLCPLALLFLSCQPEADAPIKQRHSGLSEAEFRNPPIGARPAVLWTWLNAYVNHDQMTRELEELKAKGLRGAIIWDIKALSDPEKIVPVGPRFLGDESLASIHHAMDEAERLGLELGIIAASSWNSGGSWITEEHASKDLLYSETAVVGPREFSELLPEPEKMVGPIRDTAVLAVPDTENKTIPDLSSAIRLDEEVAPDGRLTWSVPEGKWRILRFVIHNSGERLNCPSPNSDGLIIDHFSREATDVHIKHMLDRIREGRDGYGPLKLMMLDSYEVKPTTDWTPKFFEAFHERHGYDPAPYLPVLAGWTVVNADVSERFLHDYHRLIADLIAEEHYGGARETVNEYGLKLLAQAGHGGYPRVDPLQALGATDIPMGEFWNHRKNWVTKEASSAAHIYGKRIIASESFTGWRNWEDGPATYKRLFDIAVCAGLNQVNFHTFSHNPPEAGLPGFVYHAGEHFNVNVTWWDQVAPMIADMSRVCYLMQQGNFVADAVAYYGDNAPNLVPARRIAPTVEPRWTEDKCLHCGRPKPVDLDSLGTGYDYDYVNEEIIIERMEVRDGKLVLPGGMSYHLLVLPDREAIAPSVLHKIEQLVKAGATVVGPRPKRSNSLSHYPDCDDEVAELGKKIWGDCDGQEVHSHRYGKGQVFWNLPLSEILEKKGVPPAFVVEGAENAERQIDFIHRQTDREDIYFVANTTMDYRTFTGRFRVAEGRVPRFWNAEDGSVTPCHFYEVGEGFVRVELDLPPASSIFVVFVESESVDHLIKIEERVSGDSEPDNFPAIEVLAMDSGRADARVWMPGTYSFKTAEGRAGELSLDSVPEDMPIHGLWKLNFPADRGAPDQIRLDTLIDWTAHPDPGVRHFSGTATYQNRFVLSSERVADASPVYLDLGAVREVAEVTINGKKAGILWKEPYRIDISSLIREGENSLEIAVTNNWINRLIGDAGLEPDTRITRTNISHKIKPDQPLTPSGLVGPVRLRFPVSATIDLE